jgi:hypothetical protein
MLGSRRAVDSLLENSVSNFDYHKSIVQAPRRSLNSGIPRPWFSGGDPRAIPSPEQAKKYKNNWSRPKRGGLRPAKTLNRKRSRNRLRVSSQRWPVQKKGIFGKELSKRAKLVRPVKNSSTGSVLSRIIGNFMPRGHARQRRASPKKEAKQPVKRESSLRASGRVEFKVLSQTPLLKLRPNSSSREHSERRTLTLKDSSRKKCVSSKGRLRSELQTRPVFRPKFVANSRVVEKKKALAKSHVGQTRERFSGFLIKNAPVSVLIEPKKAWYFQHQTRLLMRNHLEQEKNKR